ncbi:VOC family protein [Sphingomonas sp. AOB5]|uniref:VOC family protein n=1 Tax=Sphingomonas sp. AOB5 TaxID=3034017 RepID=UPI0023F91B3B|nr:VOC family protein [Sphingomonas sp. AOB5]MDF7777751.1 VOC family protein [Sphingomonas sp. AOB5]
MALQVTGMCPLIQVFDMTASVRFYCEGLGFEVVAASPEIEAAEGRYFHWCRLRLGPAELMLNTAYDANERPPVRDAARQAAHQDTGLYFGCDDVDAIHAALRARGLEVSPPKDAPYGMRQIWLRDPDGYQLCFQRSV